MRTLNRRGRTPRRLLPTIAVLLVGAFLGGSVAAWPGVEEEEASMSTKIERTDEEWRDELTSEQYRILRKKGTEPAFSGEYWDHHETGTYRCAACGQPLFSSETKFNSGTGWPSFCQPADEEAVTAEADHSLGMVRTEVMCSRCDSHLGHVFGDGPAPTGQRFCINSASLRLEPSGE